MADLNLPPEAPASPAPAPAESKAVQPPRELRRGSLPPELRVGATPQLSPGPGTPSKHAKRMLADLVMTPPKTPPPLSARGGAPGFDKPGPLADRARALREESGPTQRARSNLSPKPPAASPGACEPSKRASITEGRKGVKTGGDLPGSVPEAETAEIENIATAVGSNAAPSAVPPLPLAGYDAAPKSASDNAGGDTVSDVKDAKESEDNEGTGAAKSGAAPSAEPQLPSITGPVVIEGWLFKLKPKVGSDAGATPGKWHKRWFQIRDGFLLYFRAPGGATPAGWLRLAQITSVTDISTDVSIPGSAVTPAFCFKVQLTTRVLYLHAKNDEELRQWKEYIRPLGPLPPVSTSKPRVLLEAVHGAPPTLAQSPVARARGGAKLATSSPLAPALTSASTVAGEEKADDYAAEAGAGSGAGDEVIIPEDTAWIKCYDADNGAYYYINGKTGDSVWSIPPTEVDYMSQRWVKCFDYENNLVFYSHAATGDERYTNTIDGTADVPPAVPSHIPDPESGRVWVEAWDASYNLPYYVNFSSGESQWEWPSDPNAHVVQHNSEDYAWYWKWLNQEDAGGDGTGTSGEASPAPLAQKFSDRNLFGSCFT